MDHAAHILAKEISKLTNEQLSALAMKCIELGIAVPLEHALHEAQLWGDDNE